MSSSSGKLVTTQQCVLAEFEPRQPYVGSSWTESDSNNTYAAKLKLLAQAVKWAKMVVVSLNRTKHNKVYTPYVGTETKTGTEMTLCRSWFLAKMTTNMSYRDHELDPRIHNHTLV